MKPLMDILENDKNIVISLGMPGVREEDISFNIEENYLRVTGKTSWNLSAELASEMDGLLPEKYMQEVVLPKNTDKKAIQAELTKGYLMIQLPKFEQLHQAA